MHDVILTLLILVLGVVITVAVHRTAYQGRKTMIRQTHTYAELEVSATAYDEIANLLRTARYDHAFVENAIDMHGLALVRQAKPVEGPRFYIRQTNRHDTKLGGYLRVEIEPGGMSVGWFDREYATPFSSEMDAEGMLKRLRERYSDPVAVVSEQP